MNTVTIQNLKEFIQRQPHNRRVSMWQSQKVDPVGCVMVHYGEAKGFEFYATMIRDGWVNHSLDVKVAIEKPSNPNNDWIDELFGSVSVLFGCKTYGQLQQLLKP